MSDDPRTDVDGPDSSRPGRVTTAMPPATPARPAPEVPAPPEIEVVETEPEVVEAAVGTEPEIIEAEPAPRPEPERVAVPPDEADTVELAQSELAEAARAAGVELTPDGDGPDTVPPDGDPTEMDAAGSPIDPRIRERRIAVTRAQGRRRLRILLAVVAVGSVVGIAWLIVMSPFLAVDDVTIAGTRHESPESVRAAMGVDDGSALAFVDTGAAAERIEKLPWIAEAKVSREWPGGLAITVVERVPVAWVQRPAADGSPRDAPGPAALVDATGRVLGDELTPPVGLPEIDGVEQLGAPGTRIAPAVTALAVALLPEGLRAQVGALTRDDGEWELTLEAPPGGAEPAAAEVRLGRMEDIAPKGAAALAVLEKLAAEEAHVSYIDVRVPGAPATR